MNQINPIIRRTTGSIIFLFGIGLALLSFLIIERQFTFYRTIQWGALIGVIIFGLISWFCTSIGYRLTFNRPNRYGSILSPISWAVLGTTFGLLGLFIAFGIIISRLYDVGYIILAIVPIIFAVLFWWAYIKLKKRLREKMTL